MTTTPRRLSSAVLAAAALTFALRAQENLELGKMWTFENAPLAYLQAEYGFAPNQQWLDTLRLASLRFGGGCSASFVSPRGLIMTNHHCARGQIAQVQGDQDWLNQGFYAKALEDEVKVPGLKVRQLVAMQDVTAQIREGIDGDDDSEAVKQKRDANKAKVIANAQRANPDLVTDVVTLFQGARFQLYSYREYDDVRLVCSPHLQTAHFGGDPDNFTYPRYGIDFTFCRAWGKDGKPADTSAHYFRWNTTGLMEDDLVFVTGSPGSTRRLLTYAQLEFQRDVWHPIVNEQIDHQLAIRKQIAKDDPVAGKAMQPAILGLENSQKAQRGYYAGLREPSLMAQKRNAEQAFRAKVAADEALRKEFGDVWDRLAEVAARRTAFEAKRRFQTTAGHPRLLQAARVLQGKRDEALEAARPEISAVERADFIDHVRRAQRWLKGDDLAWLGGKAPEQLADALEGSKLGDKDYLRSLFDGGDDAIQNSQDPALAMMRELRSLVDANNKTGAELIALEEVHGTRIGQALHAVYGDKVSPDATSTPRFSDGRIRGYPFNGTIAPWRTTFYGLYARNVEFDDHHPFDLPKPWLERRSSIDMDKSVDIVSTNDIIGGNSGSPLVNKDLEVVGLVFDGNIEMLPNNYLYRGEVARSVSVHVDAIMEALSKIYDARRVVEELTSRE